MKQAKDKNMDKRGQTAEIIGSFILITMVVASGFTLSKVIDDNRYVGDKFELKVYDLSKCDIKDVPKDNRINFKDLDEAINNGYTPAKC